MTIINSKMREKIMKQFTTSSTAPEVVFGPTDPVESFKACVYQAIIAHRGDHGKNLVADYEDRIDEYVAQYSRAGYSPEEIQKICFIAERAKSQARADGRVYARLWF
jgi:hypothetical protein